MTPWRKILAGMGAAASLAAPMTGVACGAPGAPPPAAPAPSVDTSTLETGKAAIPECAPTPESIAGIKAFDAGNYAEARASFEAAAKKNPRDYESLHNLGLASERLGDMRGAEGAYKAALAVKPELDTAAADLAALYIEAGRIDEALAVGRAGLASHPGSAALHENLGVALATHGDQDDATRELGQAITLQPSEPMFHLTLAHWLNAWHVRGATPHLDTARDLVKADYGMVASIGHEYRMAGEFVSCLKAFDRAIQIKDGGEVRTERALCKLGLKDDKGAFDDLEAAVRKEPTYATAHYYFGGRLAVLKRFREASAEYSSYLSLEPNGSLAKPAADKMKAAQAAFKDRSASTPKR